MGVMKNDISYLSLINMNVYAPVARDDKFLVIQSQDGEGNPNTPTDYVVSMGNTQYAQERIIAMVPKFASVPNVFYNATTLFNTIILSSNGNPDVTVTLTPGFYNLNDVQAAINAALISGGYPPVTLAGNLSGPFAGKIISSSSVPHQYFVAGTFSARLGLTTDTSNSTTVIFDSTAN